MIFIVIPVFNRKEFTYKCLKSLFRQTCKNYKNIVIDDGSTDATSHLIAKEFPEVILLKGDGNLWWAGATNIGIRHVFNKMNVHESEDYVLTLNNDLEVPEQYLESLVRNASIYTRTVLGSVSVDITNPEYMDFCGIKWNEFTGKYHSKAKNYNYSYEEFRDKEKIVDSDMLPGRGTLIPISVFNEIGVFDSLNFPQYASDEDFTLRAKRNGWNLVIPSDVYLKSHIAQTGIDTSNIQFNFKYLKDLFFSIRSPLNLKIRYRFALKNTRLKILYFLIGLARISLSLMQAMVTQNIKKLKSAK